MDRQSTSKKRQGHTERNAARSDGTKISAALAAAVALASAAVLSSRPASAATVVTWNTPALTSDSAVSSTAGQTAITVSNGANYQAGDVIQFTGTTSSTNPFGTSAANYYVASVIGNTITVSATPGGAAAQATNTTTTSTTAQGQDLLTGANWQGGAAPNSNSQTASFTSLTASVPAFVVGPGNQTLYGLSMTAGGNTDLTLASGWSGSGTTLNTLTFDTNDASTPIVTLNSTGRVIFFGTTSTNALKLAVAGTKGLIFNSTAGGAISGTGTAATSTTPAKNIRLNNVDWSNFSGGITVERGELAVQAAGGALPNQTLTVGDAQTLTNNLLAGLNLANSGSTVDALNGNSLGRIYGNNTLTVGNAGGSGNFGGVIGVNFAGTASATNLTKAGAGTQTISGLVAGTGAVTVSNGTLVLSGGNSYLGATTVNSGGTLQIGNATALGGSVSTNLTTTSGSNSATVASATNLAVGQSVVGTNVPGGTTITAISGTTVTLSQNASGTGTNSAGFAGTTAVSSGGTLDLNGQSTSEVLNVAGTGIGGNGALVNSNTTTAATVNSESTNSASFTVGGAGYVTLQRVRSGGGPITLTKIGSGTLTLGNANTSSHMNLLAVDVESASTVNFGITSGNFIVADRGVKIAAGGTVKFTGTSNIFTSSSSEVIVSNGTLNMNGVSDTAGKLTIGDGTNNGLVTGPGSTYTVNGTYNLFGTNTGGGASTIEAMSGSASVNLAGAVALNKTTGGTVTLSGSNSYSGGTNVSAGSLVLASSSALAGTGDVGVSGGSLTSNVSATTLGGNLNLSGTGALSPNGAGVGSFTLGTNGKSLSMTGGTLAETIASASSYDQITDGASTAGTFSISGGTLDLSSSTAGIDYTQTYAVLSGFTSGSVANLAITGYDTADYVANLSNTGVLSFTPVPEPASLGLMGMATAGLLMRRRRGARRPVSA